MNGLMGVASQTAGFGNPNIMAEKAAAPRPLGYMERLAGLRNGTQELRSMLEAFAGRLVGAPANASGNAPSRADIEGMLEEAEMSLRGSFEILVALNKAF